jgi:hypothetical protein
LIAAAAALTAANYRCQSDDDCDADLGFTCDTTSSFNCVDNGGSSNNGGDPHFVSFNNESWSWHGGCTVVLFRSQHSDIDVHIQTTRVETSTKLKYSYISGVAAKIQSDVFEVLSDDGSFIINGGEKVLPHESAFEQARISRSYKGSKKNIIVYDFDLSKEATGDGKNTSSGGPARSMQIRANTNTGILYVDFHGSFPDGEGLTGSTSSPALLGRDGKTNFSGHYNSFAEEWQVLDTEQNLFQQPQGPQHPEGCIYDVDSMTTMMQHHQKTSSSSTPSSIRRRLLVEAREEVTMEQASEACANVKRQEFCIMDVMAMADLEIAEDPFYQQEQ